MPEVTRKAIEEVRWRRTGSEHVVRVPRRRLAHPRQPFLAHQPCHALTAHHVPPSNPLGMNPRHPAEPAPRGGSEGPSQTLMHRPDLAAQLLIAPRMARTPATSPRLSHPLGETPGTSWPLGVRLGSPSRTRRPPAARPGLPSDQAAAFFKSRLPSADNKTTIREPVNRTRVSRRVIGLSQAAIADSCS